MDPSGSATSRPARHPWASLSPLELATPHDDSSDPSGSSTSRCMRRAGTVTRAAAGWWPGAMPGDARTRRILCKCFGPLAPPKRASCLGPWASRR
eukprot:10583356-Alexandrium_andersonii.AAC.1